MAHVKEALALFPPLLAPVEEGFNVEALLDEALAPLRWRATIKRISLKCAVPAGLPRLCADRTALLRRVRNLLSQAIEGGERGGTILCAARLGGGGALFVEFHMTEYGLERRLAEGAAGPIGRLLATLPRTEFDICPASDGRLTVRLRFPTERLRASSPSGYRPAAAAF